MSKTGDVTPPERADAYAAHRRELLTASLPAAAKVVSLIAVTYAVADFFRSGTLGAASASMYVVVSLIGPLTIALLRGPMRDRPEALALAADLVFTLALSLRLGAGASTISGTAVFLTAKLMATALFFPWDARLQYISAAYTLGMYWAAMVLVGKPLPWRVPLHQGLAPIMTALLSMAGAAVAERKRRDLFEQAERVKASEAALRISEERFRALVEHAFDEVSLLRPDGTIAYASSRRSLMGDVPREDLLGQLGFVYVHPDDLPRCQELFAEVLSRPDGTATTELRIPDDKGGWRWVESRARNMISNPAVGAVVINSRDITERKRAEDEVHRLNADLERRVVERTMQFEMANKELEAFSYSVSHDLRAPLRAIKGFSGALLEEQGSRLDQAGRGYLQRVHAAVGRMEDLIEDLLGLSRLTSGEMHWTTVDLSAMARAISETLRHAEPNRQVEWRIEDGLAVRGDARLLRVAMENLLGNAWKYTGKQPQARIEVGRAPRGDGWACFVRDNGAGFDMTYAEKLFSPFNRLHTANEFEGTGIGLATVQRIIHRHGGHVWAESEIGRGATFFFALPDRPPA